MKKASETDWVRIDQMGDDEIDTSDIPPLGDEFFAAAQWRMPKKGVAMLNTVRAVVKEGRIQLLEQIELPEGTEMLVTPLPDDADFWLKAGESSLDAVWDNGEDDVYAQLLAK